MAKINPEKIKLKDGREVLFRSLEPKDASLYNAFKSRALGEFPYVTEFKDISESPVDIHIGVFDGDKMIGVLELHQAHSEHPWAKHTCTFRMMIFKEYWFNGIGQKLLQLMEDHARRAGIVKIEAQVLTDNLHGWNLFRKAGYQIEGTRKAAAFIDGRYQDEFFISKFLIELEPAWRPPRLESERLILRSLVMSDAESIFKYTSNENVARYVGWDAHKNIDDTRNYIRDVAYSKYSDGQAEPLGIELKTNPGVIIGTVGAFWSNKNMKILEIGFALAEEQWGKGIIVEAATTLLLYLCGNYEFGRIQIRCKVPNFQSARVIEKLGFKFEGIAKQAFFSKMQFWDMRVYSLARDEVMEKFLK